MPTRNADHRYVENHGVELRDHNYHRVNYHRVNYHGVNYCGADYRAAFAASPVSTAARGAAAALLAALGLLVAGAGAQAQDTSVPTMPTDRPGQVTLFPTVVTPGSVQLETGVIYLKDGDGPTLVTTLRYPTTLVRIGLANSLELRLGGEYLAQHITGGVGGTASSISGIQALSVGGKLYLAPEHGMVPEMAIAAQIGLPLGAAALRPKSVAPSVTFAAKNTLSDLIGLYSNAGLIWNGSDATPGFGYGIYCMASPTSTLCGFFELYGTLSLNGAPINAFDAGLALMVSPDLQFDVSGGIGISVSAPDFFVSGGICYRFLH